MLLPSGKGYLEATLGLGSTFGPFGRVEAGWRPAEHLGAFGFAQAQAQGWMAGLGARLTW